MRTLLINKRANRKRVPHNHPQILSSSRAPSFPWHPIPDTLMPLSVPILIAILLSRMYEC
jgi:hypothetical protein